MNPQRLEAPSLELDDATLEAFKAAWRSAVTMHEAVPPPPPNRRLHEWLRWMVTTQPVLLHGSNRGDIDTFTPRWQLDFLARFRKGVWATSDGIWPMFFAIVDRSRYEGTLRNDCWWEMGPEGERRKRYRFSLNAAMMRRGPWTSGTVYVLPRGPFQRIADDAGNLLEEWVSPQAVRPLACVRVAPEDFPFLADVQQHEDTAPVLGSPHRPAPEADPHLLDRVAGLYALDDDFGLRVSRTGRHLSLEATNGFLHTDLWRAPEGHFFSPHADLEVRFEHTALLLWLHGRETRFPKVPTPAAEGPG